MKIWHWITFLILTMITVLIQVLGDYKRPNVWDNIPLFYTFYGFIGCTLIIFISKWLGKLLIQKDEDFYDDF